MTKHSLLNDPHLRAALGYLRGGNALGAKSIEQLVREAADAIDPNVTTSLSGVGVAYPNVRQAVLLLTDVVSELGLSLGAHQERMRQIDRARERQRKQRKPRSALRKETK
jgi:hypothetical protein